jgi:hypothetical protein
MEWSDESLTILNNIRLNCILLNKYYKKEHVRLHAKIKYFRIPLIVLNGVSATASVGLSGYGISQSIISGIVCVIGLTNGIIGSIELFIGIEKMSEIALVLSKDFYCLATDIYKTITLNREERGIDSSTFLNESYSRYIELIRQNGCIDKVFNDQLVSIDDIKPLVKIPSPIKINEKSFEFNDDINIIV